MLEAPAFQEGLYTFLVTAYKEPLNEQRRPVTASATLRVLTQRLIQVLITTTSGDLQSFPSNMPLHLACLASGAPSTKLFPQPLSHPLLRHPKSILCTSDQALLNSLSAEVNEHSSGDC